jgi:AraC family ethanolamine operon transcriptional activator
MQFPQALPLRRTDLATDDASALSAAQPERGRDYVQLGRGELRATLRERSYGAVALLHERWSRPLRVRCARPRSYVAFSAVASAAPASWCGLVLEVDAVLEVGRDWELTSRAPFESLSFAVERGALERTEAALAGGEEGRSAGGNRLLVGPEPWQAAGALRRQVAKALELEGLAPEARAMLASDLLHLAARLRGWGRCGASPESASRRRAAVRLIEEYLAAHPRALPSLAELCALAGVSERTLEYAFREQLGLTPGRYLRVRRLNGARRELRSGAPDARRVTDVAMRWGFWELGRFASDYRTLFGERPSETLAAARRGT